MGEAKAGKRRFLAEHPICCFCGGGVPATTIDHIPARVCFPDRHPPEGFEFPACDRCQNASRLDELAFGMFVRLGDADENNYRQSDVKRLISGVANNLPNILPRIDLSPRAKRNSLRAMGLQKPSHVLAADIPLMAVPTDIQPHMHRYGCKLACALFYREMGKAAPADYHVWAIWGQEADRARMASWDKFVSMTPLVTIGQRSNFDFGNRFRYRCNKTAPPQPDLFAAVAQFGEGIAVAVVIVHETSEIHALEVGEWKTVADMFD